MNIKQWLLINKLNVDNILTKDILSYKNNILKTDRSIRFTNLTDRYFLTDGKFNLSFDEVGSLDFEFSKIEKIQFPQHILRDLRFSNCENITSFDFSNIHFANTQSESFHILHTIDFVGCKSLTLLENIKSANSFELLLHNSYFDKISFVKDQEVNYVSLIDTNVKSFAQIRNGRIFKLRIHNSMIRKFSAHTAQSIRHCDFDCKYIQCYSNIDQLKILSSLKLSNIHSYKNMLQLLTSDCKNIEFDNVYNMSSVHGILFNEVAKNIIDRYLGRMQRKEFIMDCALELIEHGCEEALI